MLAKMILSEKAWLSFQHLLSTVALTNGSQSSLKEKMPVKFTLDVNGPQSTGMVTTIELVFLFKILLFI